MLELNCSLDTFDWLSTHVTSSIDGGREWLHLRYDRTTLSHRPLAVPLGSIGMEQISVQVSSSLHGPMPPAISIGMRSDDATAPLPHGERASRLSCGLFVVLRPFLPIPVHRIHTTSRKSPGEISRRWGWAGHARTRVGPMPAQLGDLPIPFLSFSSLATASLPPDLHFGSC